jgi:GntR family transcriptional regulator
VSQPRRAIAYAERVCRLAGDSEPYLNGCAQKEKNRLTTDCMAVTIQPTTMLKPVHLQIDPHSGLPVYRQIMDQVRYYVASGVLQPGDQLPSIRELANKLAVNPTTIVKAYSELEHAGVIEMRHGKGVFVAQHSMRMSDREREKALRRLARQLAVEAAQMSAPTPLVVRIVEEELAHLNNQAT